MSVKKIAVLGTIASGYRFLFKRAGRLARSLWAPLLFITILHLSEHRFEIGAEWLERIYALLDTPGAILATQGLLLYGYLIVITRAHEIALDRDASGHWASLLPNGALVTAALAYGAILMLTVALLLSTLAVAVCVLLAIAFVVKPITGVTVAAFFDVVTKGLAASTGLFVVDVLAQSVLLGLVIGFVLLLLRFMLRLSLVVPASLEERRVSVTKPWALTQGSLLRLMLIAILGGGSAGLVFGSPVLLLDAQIARLIADMPPEAFFLLMSQPGVPLPPSFVPAVLAFSALDALLIATLIAFSVAMAVSAYRQAMRPDPIKAPGEAGKGAPAPSPFAPPPPVIEPNRIPTDPKLTA